MGLVSRLSPGGYQCRREHAMYYLTSSVACTISPLFAVFQLLGSPHHRPCTEFILHNQNFAPINTASLFLSFHPLTAAILSVSTFHCPRSLMHCLFFCDASINDRFISPSKMFSGSNQGITRTRVSHVLSQDKIPLYTYTLDMWFAPVS